MQVNNRRSFFYCFVLALSIVAHLVSGEQQQQQPPPIEAEPKLSLEPQSQPQPQPLSESAQPVASMPISLAGNAVTVTDLDTSEPTLWQMAAYAARQISTKQQKLKLATLNAAELITDTGVYRLRVTLQRVIAGQPINFNDVLYCTVEVKSDSQSSSPKQQQWSVDNFGCTLPAIVRRRRPGSAKKAINIKSSVPPTPAVVAAVNNANIKQEVVVPAQTKYDKPIENTISHDPLMELEENRISGEPVVVRARKQIKRQTNIVRPATEPLYYYPSYSIYRSPYPIYYYRY